MSVAWAGTTAGAGERGETCQLFLFLTEIFMRYNRDPEPGIKMMKLILYPQIRAIKCYKNGISWVPTVVNG